MSDSTPGTPGRHTLCTPERTAIICEALEGGAYLATAAALAGLHPDTVYKWLKRGAEGEEPYATFASAVESAQATGEKRLLDLIRAAAAEPKHWQAAAWMLERKFPDRYGRKMRVEAGPPAADDEGEGGPAQATCGVIVLPILESD